MGLKDPLFPEILLIFVIKKRSDKWRLLIDLQNVNAIMWPMGGLQPGLPMFTTIPKV